MIKATVKVPPIKIQGIKTKLVEWVKKSVQWNQKGVWIEPFMGSGVVGFNVNPKNAIFSDSNPYIIEFYNKLNSGDITPEIIKLYLENEGDNLKKFGEEYYYNVRDRFNEYHNPLDFLFLNRSCFNGVIRFNRKGGFNVPFGHKVQRFSQAYITKIFNQSNFVFSLMKSNNWAFVCQDYKEALVNISSDDFIYCDPPYVGRHVDYYDSWDEESENELFRILKNTPANFILSTWHSNQYRKNDFINSFWSKFNVITKEHFYHVGAKESNRNAVYEALLSNVKLKNSISNSEMKSRVESDQSHLTTKPKVYDRPKQLKLSLEEEEQEIMYKG